VEFKYYYFFFLSFSFSFFFRYKIFTFFAFSSLQTLKKQLDCLGFTYDRTQGRDETQGVSATATWETRANLLRKPFCAVDGFCKGLPPASCLLLSCPPALLACWPPLWLITTTPFVLILFFFLFLE